MLVILINKEFQELSDELHREVLYVICGPVKEFCEINHSHLFHLEVSISICNHSKQVRIMKVFVGHFQNPFKIFTRYIISTYKQRHNRK